MRGGTPVTEPQLLVPWEVGSNWENIGVCININSFSMA